MEGGLITLVVLIVIAPFQIWGEWSKKFAMLSPVEQNLQRAANGFAVMVLSVLTPIALYGAKEVFAFFPALVTQPGEAASGLVFVLPFILGLVRFLVGWKRSCAMRISDWLLASRAFVRLAIGFAGVKWLRWDVERAFDQLGFMKGLLLVVLLTVSWWWLLTGIIRFLLTVGIRMRPQRPPVHPSPRGRARDASQEETREAMSGSGGRKIDLDERSF
jgi:hypothetical protein